MGTPASLTQIEIDSLLGDIKEEEVKEEKKLEAPSPPDSHQPLIKEKENKFLLNFIAWLATKAPILINSADNVPTVKKEEILNHFSLKGADKYPCYMIIWNRLKAKTDYYDAVTKEQYISVGYLVNVVVSILRSTGSEVNFLK